MVLLLVNALLHAPAPKKVMKGTKIIGEEIQYISKTLKVRRCFQLQRSWDESG